MSALAALLLTQSADVESARRRYRWSAPVAQSERALVSCVNGAQKKVIDLAAFKKGASPALDRLTVRWTNDVRKICWREDRALLRARSQDILRVHEWSRHRQVAYVARL